jgi:ribosomal protein S18 acetylase RimI-like enzyme
MTTHAVRLAQPADEEPVTLLMADRFHDDPVSAWVFPDDTDRRARHPDFFRPFVQLAMAHGRVDVVGEYGGAALWLDVVDVPPDPDVDRLQAACGPNWARAERLFGLFEKAHPTEPHAYLPFIAARPGHGFGTALLAHRAGELDELGQAAYLEASSARSVGLYRRLGFEHLGDPIQPAGGPPLRQMWRPPQLRPRASG